MRAVTQLRKLNALTIQAIYNNYGIISIELHAKLQHDPPPFVSWAEDLSTQRVGEDVCIWPAPKFGQTIGVNLKVFFFAFHLILGKKLDQI